MRLTPARRSLAVICLGTLLGFVTPSLLMGEKPVPEAQAKKKKKKKKSKKRKSKKSKKDDAADDDGKRETAVPPKNDAKKEEPEELRTTGPAQLQAPAADKKVDKKDLTEAADKKRDESIAEIKGLLPKVSGAQKGELVFRLAELYWAKSKYIYTTEFQDFDTAYQDWVDNGRQGKEPTLERYLKKSEAYKKQALDNYAYVLKNFPDYPRLDEVLYIMAYNEYQAGKKDPAIKNYSKLIRQYPNSEYVPDSYLALGEHYFGANKLPKATKAYTKAYKTGKQAKKPGTYRYALYKLAWCDYNAQTYEDALKKFKAVVKDSEKAAEGTDGDATQLKREALNDMVLTYAQLDQVEPAHEYLAKHAGKERAYQLMNKLGAVYNKDGKYKQQIQTLRFVVNLDPDYPGAPDYQSQIVAAYSQLGDRDMVRKETTRLVELYRPGSNWWKKNQSDKMATERALVIAEQRMRDMVTEYHRYAQKFKKYDDYELARDLYAQYLNVFPDTEYAYNLNFYYAEILWDLGEWQKAAEAYDAVVTRDPNGKYTRDCAFNAILAWEKIVKGEPPPVRNKSGELEESKGKKGNIRKEKVKLVEVKKGGKYEKEKIPFAEEKLALACDAYVRVVPEKAIKGDVKLKDELIQVKFKSAYIFQKYYHFDEAADRFGELIRRWPDNDFARRGADSILDSYAAREKWTPLEKWSREFSKNDELMKDKKFAASVEKFKEGASFKSIQELYEGALAEEKKAGKKDDALVAKYTESAGRFEGFVAEFPKSEFAAIAQYNAMDIYDGALKLDLALEAAQKLLQDYGKELTENKTLADAKVDQKVKLNMVRYYEKTARYAESAEWSLKFLDDYGEGNKAKNDVHPKAADVLYNSGIFYLGLGDTKNAIISFQRYIKEYPKQKDIPSVYLRIASVFEDKEQWAQAATLYQNFEKAHGKEATKDQILSSRYKTALMLAKAGREDQSKEVCQKEILGAYKQAVLKKSDVGQLAGGYCAFKMLEEEWLAYKAIKIESDVKVDGLRGRKKIKAQQAAMKQIKEKLDAKLKQRDTIAKKYIDVLQYGSGEWGVAGLYRAAEALLDYVDTLRNAPDPPALADNFDALDIFRAELDNIAFPVEDEAIKALETALNKAYELGIYSEYTLAIQNRLRQFKPSAFGEQYELPFFPSTGAEKPATIAKR